MNEKETGLELIKDAVKGVADDAYQDVVHPVAKPTGQLVGLVPRTIKAALAPLEKWILHREYSVEETKKLLEEKLKDVPAEQIVTPEAYVAVPAMQNISYCMDNDELRNLYANLLAKSMTEVNKSNVHPSYVDIIKQLTPDEAKLLRYIATNFYSAPLATLSLRRENSQGHYITLYQHYSDAGEKANCEKPFNIQAMFDNLVRLGLLEFSPKGTYLTNKELYNPLKNHPNIVMLKARIMARIKDDYNIIKDEEGYVSLTEFGKQFCKICVLD